MWRHVHRRGDFRSVQFPSALPGPQTERWGGGCRVGVSVAAHQAHHLLGCRWEKEERADWCSLLHVHSLAVPTENTDQQHEQQKRHFCRPFHHICYLVANCSSVWNRRGRRRKTSEATMTEKRESVGGELSGQKVQMRRLDDGTVVLGPPVDRLSGGNNSRCSQAWLQAIITVPTFPVPPVTQPALSSHLCPSESFIVFLPEETLETLPGPTVSPFSSVTSLFCSTTNSVCYSCLNNPQLLHRWVETVEPMKRPKYTFI